MWIAFITGWVLGSASLYAYMVVTAKEPQQQECMDCKLSECIECPNTGATAGRMSERRAA